MNLKQAFRFQNKLDELMEYAEEVLSNQQNVTQVKITYMKSKVDPAQSDETSFEQRSCEYSDHITELSRFVLYLLSEKEKLEKAVCECKRGLSFDLDGEVGLNGKRQSIARLFRSMNSIKGSDLIIPNGGFGYRFNTDGNQVAYKCDIKKVTTINFDRNVIRGFAVKMAKVSDETSARIDDCMVNSKVGYTEPFDVNDAFGDVFDAYLEGSLK